MVVDGDSDSQDVLNIGGVRLQVGRDGNVKSMSRTSKKQRKKSFKDTTNDNEYAFMEPTAGLSEGDEDSDIIDFFRNVTTKSSEDEEDSDSAFEDNTDEGKNKSDESKIYGESEDEQYWTLMKHFSNTEMGHEGAVEDIFQDNEAYSDSEDDSDSSFSSDSYRKLGDPLIRMLSGEEMTDYSRSEGRSAESSGVLTNETLEMLPAQERYPVQVRPMVASISNDGRNFERSDVIKNGSSKRNTKQKKGKKGVPGEKARSRRVAIETRRMERALARGLDLVTVNQQIIDFIEQNIDDVYVFPPMAKQDCSRISKLASMYGCKAGAQGSGKKRSVVLSRTRNTAIPKGDNLLQIGHMITMSSCVELRGSSEAARIVNQANSQNDRWHGSGKKSRRRSKNQLQFADDVQMLLPRRESKSTKNIEFVSHGTVFEDEKDEDGVIVSIPGRSLDMDQLKLDSNEDGESVELEEILEGGAGSLPIFEHRRSCSSDRRVTDHEKNINSIENAGFSGRGKSAASGITNPGRLLGLGMALGIGSDIFGALGPLDHTTDEDNHDVKIKQSKKMISPSVDSPSYTCSPLQPKPSKSTLKKLKKKHAKSSTKSPQTSEVQDLGANSTEAYNFTSWERHTTGVGSRLLAKWGFAGEGSGLGRQGQGIAEPVKAVQRAKKLGLGAER